MIPTENPEKLFQPTSPSRFGRRKLLQLLGGVSLASLVAACAPTPQPKVVLPTEAKPALNPPAKPDIKLQPTETPEKRANAWFNSVVTGNKTEYVKQFPPNDPPLPLQEGLSNMYKNCNIDQADISFKALSGSENKLEVIIDFNQPCIPGGKRGPARYIRIIEQKRIEAGQVRYYIESAAPSNEPN